ncbi:MAG: glutamate--tRNA ligase [Gaiellales bacterium]|nr:MAG: glutamate--tRNA ligase [Gaiellales bacterium]
MGNEVTVRTRFAPSPTGHLHVGGARTALFSWLFARSMGGAFILRIEDTDTARSTEAAVEQIISSMAWLGLDWDEGPGKGGACGPYRQMERAGLYESAAQRLFEEGRAYRCYCSPKALEDARRAAREEGRQFLYPGTCREGAGKQASGDYVVRLRTPDSGSTVVRDLVRGDVEFDDALSDDFIIVRSNGVPTYNFAAAVDDDAMAVSHVIRGDDHLPNTPKQIHVIQALGGTVPAYAHLPLILGPDQSPLSKRHGSVSVEEFRSKGYIREAMINYLALLGWSLDGETTLFTLEELVSSFTLERVGKNAAVFDNDKLLWMNGSHIRSLPGNELAQRVEEYLAGGPLEGLPGSDGLPGVADLVPLVHEKMKTLEDFITLTGFFFLPFAYEEKALSKLLDDENAPGVLAAAREVIAAIEPYDAGGLESSLRERADKMDIKLGRFLQPVRIAVSGRTVTPGMFETLMALGREKSLERIDAAAGMLSSKG